MPCSTLTTGSYTKLLMPCPAPSTLPVWPGYRSDNTNTEIQRCATIYLTPPHIRKAVTVANHRYASLNYCFLQRERNDSSNVVIGLRTVIVSKYPVGFFAPVAQLNHIAVGEMTGVFVVVILYIFPLTTCHSILVVNTFTSPYIMTHLLQLTFSGIWKVKTGLA